MPPISKLGAAVLVAVAGLAAYAWHQPDTPWVRSLHEQVAPWQQQASQTLGSAYQRLRSALPGATALPDLAAAPAAHSPHTAVASTSAAVVANAATSPAGQAAARANADGAVKRCVRGTEVTYTNLPCEADARAAPLERGSVTTVPAKPASPAKP